MNGISMEVNSCVLNAPSPIYHSFCAEWWALFDRMGGVGWGEAEAVTIWSRFPNRQEMKRQRSVLMALTDCPWGREGKHWLMVTDDAPLSVSPNIYTRCQSHLGDTLTAYFTPEINVDRVIALAFFTAHTCTILEISLSRSHCCGGVVRLGWG